MTAVVCDLGGTNCRFGVVRDLTLDTGSIRSLSNDAYPSFEDAFLSYLEKIQLGDALSDVVIALAAPPNGDTAELTNRDWRLSKTSISAASDGAEVSFINDFEALGYALKTVEGQSTKEILAGVPADFSASKLVLGAGTGFNSAALSRDGSVVVCETGHSTFPVESKLDRWIQDSFSSQFGRCSLDRVLSGSGLLALYHGVCSMAQDDLKYINSSEIVLAGLTDHEPLARLACAEFCRILGRTAGDLALIFQSYGGVYMSGGVTRALAPMLSRPDGPFAIAFQAKGRMTQEVSTIPVHLFEDDSSALFGCVAWLAEKLQSESEKNSKNTKERTASAH
jgi:glucokinase